MNVINQSRSNSSLLNVCGGHLSTLLFQIRRRRCRLHHFCWILLVLSIFLITSRRKQKIFILQQQQQQQHVILTFKHSDGAVITVNNTSITHEQKVSSTLTPVVMAPHPSSSSSLFVNHSADYVIERKEGCNNQKQDENHHASGCRLEFVHIPKAGGTAVELAGIMANISWGACRFFDTVWVDAHHKTNCPPLTGGLTPRIGKLRLIHHNMLPRGAKVNDFHLPPHYFLDAPSQFANNNNNNGKNKLLNHLNPYHDVALFAIVRDPYARAISEYYHIKGRDNNDHAAKNSRGVQNAVVMNRWLEEHLAPMMAIYNTNTVDGESSSQTMMPRSSSSIGAVYYQRDGHFIPQYDYIFDGAGPQQQQQQQTRQHRRVVHHVLHFEHLQADFAKLMAAYNLSAALPNPEESKQQPDGGNHGGGGNNVLVARKTRDKKLNKYNLTLDNIRRIETIYARDFATFGYSTISSAMEKR